MAPTYAHVAQTGPHPNHPTDSDPTTYTPSKINALSPDTAHVSPDTAHVSPDTAHVSPDTTHVSPDTTHVSPDTTHGSHDTISTHTGAGGTSSPAKGKKAGQAVNGGASGGVADVESIVCKVDDMTDGE